MGSDKKEPAHAPLPPGGFLADPWHVQATRLRRCHRSEASRVFGCHPEPSRVFRGLGEGSAFGASPSCSAGGFSPASSPLDAIGTRCRFLAVQGVEASSSPILLACTERSECALTQEGSEANGLRQETSARASYLGGFPAERNSGPA